MTQPLDYDVKAAAQYVAETWADIRCAASLHGSPLIARRLLLIRQAFRRPRRCQNCGRFE